MRKSILFLLLPLFFISCKSQHVFMTEAHRGGRGLMPENTIPAMYNAIDIGINTIEMDIHITADQEVVVTHDAFLNSLTTLTPQGKEFTKEYARENLVVYSMNYNQLRDFNVGSKALPAFPQQKKIESVIPRLSDLIDSVQRYLDLTSKAQVFYDIETKTKEEGDGIYHPEPAEFVALLMEVIEQHKITPFVVIQSFDKRTLQVIHKNYPGVKTTYLVNNNKSFEENIEELGFNPYRYSPPYKTVTAALVKKCHDRDIRILPSNVNVKSEIERLKALNVDGIITDYPNLLVD